MSLKWIMELYDKVSGPAEKMSKATEHFEHSMEKAGGSTEKMAKAQKQLSAERIAVMTEVAHLGVEAFDELTEKVVEFGKELLEASDYERTTQIVFEAMAGSAVGGAALFEKAQDYANKAGISIKESVGLFKTLTAGGIKDQGQDLFILAQAAGDVGLMTGASAQSIVQSFADIQSKGELTGRQLQQFVGAIPMDQLAKKLGVASGSFHDLQEQLTKNPASAQKGIQAIIATLQDAEGGSLGNIRKKVGEGFEGASERISNAMHKAMGAFSETEGFKHLIEDMDRLAKRIEDPAFATSISNIATNMLKLAEATARVVEKLGELAGWGAKQYSKEGFLYKYTLGGGTGAALRDGFDKAKELFQDSGTAIGGAIETGTKTRLGVRSPSKVFEEIGGYSAEGFSIGYLNQKNDSLGVPTTTGAPAGGTQSSTGHMIHVHQNFTIHAEQGMDIEELAHRINETAATRLQSPLEELALSMGTL